MPLKLTANLLQDRYSWTESHYLLNFSALPPVGIVGPTPLDAVVGSYSTLRTATLGNYAVVDSIRVSEVPANRLVADYFTTYSVSPPVWPADPTGDVYSSDRAYSAVLVRMLGSIGNKNWFLAGVPDSTIQTGPLNRRGISLGGSPGWLARFTAFMSFLTSGNAFGFRSRTADGQIQAQGLVTNAAFPAMIGVVTAVTLGLNVGQSVLVKGWRRNNARLGPLTGGYVIGGVLPPTTPATNWTYFLLNTAAVNPTNFLGLGTIGPLSFQFIPYEGFEPIKAVSHKRGASYGAPRGRSSRRAH